MKFNPFKAELFKDLLVFHDKNEYMFLKMYHLNNISIIKLLIEDVKKIMTPFHDIQYCLSFHYDGTKRIPFFSINCKWNGNFYQMQEVEDIFKDVDLKVSGSCSLPCDPYKIAYMQTFDGIDEFLVTLRKNRAYLHDPNSKEILRSLAFFHMNLHNLSIVPNFFNLVDDLSFRMKLQLDIYFIFKEQNNKVNMKASFVFIEPNHQRFSDTLVKLRDVKELNAILEDVDVNKTYLAELFIKRALDKNLTQDTSSDLTFFAQYFLGNLEKPIPAIAVNCYNPVPPQATSLPTTSNKTHVISNGKIGIDASYTFKTAIDCMKTRGFFIDAEESIFDAGETIIALIQDLDVNGLLTLFKDYIGKKKFRLVFVDPAELTVFSSHFDAGLENVYEICVLPVFLEMSKSEPCS
jgi:hypothetical protein